MKRALSGAAVLAAALVLAVAGSAATLPGGTSISAAITSPASGTVYPQGTAVTVDGTASIGQGVQAQNTTIVYIVDVSGSTDAVTSTNCPNSTVYKSIGNTTLDCEVLAVRAVNRQAVINGNVGAVGLIAFGGCPNTCGMNSNGLPKGTTADAAAADLDPSAAIATLAPPNAGPPPSLIYRFAPNNNLEAVLQSAYVNNDATPQFPGWPTPVISPAQDGFTQFNQPGGTHVGANTNYWAAMMALDNLAHSITTPNTVVIFVSDGDSNTTGPNGEVVSNAINAIKTDPNIHTTIKAFTFGMGNGADCVAPLPNAGSMQDISGAFSGTCTPLGDPSLAAQFAPALIQSHLSSVSYTADGNASTPSQTVSATGPGSAPFSHTFSGLANGAHTLCATAHGSDSGGSGDSDPACVDVTLQAPPTLLLSGGDGSNGVAGEINEGSSFAVGATANTTGSFTDITWTSDGGSHCVFADPHALNTSVRCDNGDAIYALTLTVTDNATPAQSVSATEHLQVDNVPPTIVYSVTPDTVGLNNPQVHAHVDITDPGAETWTCTFSWADGSPDTVVTTTVRSCDADHTFAAAGVFPTHVEVTDDGLVPAEGTHGVTVQAPPTIGGLPTDGANGAPADSVDEGTAYPLNADVGPGVTLQWTASLNAPGHCSLTSDTGASTSLTCDDNGIATVDVTATDGFGQVGHATFHLQVNNVAPSITISSPTSSSTDRAVTFTALVTDPGTNDTETCSIDWGDGSAVETVAILSSTGTCNATHTYAATLQSATLTAWVTDDDNGASAHKVVPLTFDRPPMCVNVHADIATLWPADHRLVLVTLVGATDPDTGDTLTYAITNVTQDEPTSGLGSGDTSPDAKAAAGGSVWLRAERAGTGDGRVYTITYTVTDASSAPCAGGPLTVKVRVPHDQNHAAVDSGHSYNSFG